MVVVGLDYGFAGQMKLDEVTGGSPYGVTTIAGGDGSRKPSENELAGARYQGRVIAETAKKLHGRSDTGGVLHGECPPIFTKRGQQKRDPAFCPIAPLN